MQSPVLQVLLSNDFKQFYYNTCSFLMSEQSNTFRGYEWKKGKETRKAQLIMENNNKKVVKHSCVGEGGEGSGI